MYTSAVMESLVLNRAANALQASAHEATWWRLFLRESFWSCSNPHQREETHFEGFPIKRYQETCPYDLAAALPFG